MGKEKETTLTVIGGSKSSHRIKYSGVYDLQGLVKGTQQFLRDRGYSLSLGAQEEKTGGSSRDYKFEFTASRKVTEYIQFEIKFVVEIKGSSDVAVEQEGKKQKVQKGNLELLVKATMKKNYKKKFPGEFLRQSYEKYLAKSELDRYEDKLEGEAKEFLDNLKEYLPSYRR